MTLLRRRHGGADPMPAPGCPLRDLPLLALDLETTGLDPVRGEIVAVGMVPVDGTVVRLDGAWQSVVRPAVGRGVGDSATVHGLTDDAVAAGCALSDVVSRVLGELSGRVLLAHHAAIEVGFLSRACRRVGRDFPEVRVVDTVRLHRRVLGRGRSLGHVGEDELRLGSARAHLGLPSYPDHDALTDALACAELYLAQVEHLGGADGLRLRQVASRVPSSR